MNQGQTSREQTCPLLQSIIMRNLKIFVRVFAFVIIYLVPVKSILHAQTWTALTNAPSQHWWRMASSADGEKLVAGINTWSSVGNGGIYCSTNGGTTWTLSSAPSYDQSWATVSCSTNGNILVAAGIYVTEGVNSTYEQLYTSPDSGTTWNLADVPALGWTAVASSADGTKLVALAAQTNFFMLRRTRA